MAVAAPRRTPAAPAPARTAPPEPKRRPRDRPKPGGRTAAPRKASGAAAPARTAPSRKSPSRKGPGGKAAAATAPARKAPARRKAASARAATTAPARRAPARKSPARRAAPGAQPRLALVVGRTATTVRGLPDSGPIVRLTRGRSWIALLGVLLVGIVALNVVTLSFAASSGKIGEKATALEKENSQLGGRMETKFSQERIRGEAAKLGLAMSTTTNPHLVIAGKGDVATAAARLAAASPE
jgi:hypothetical protein